MDRCNLSHNSGHNQYNNSNINNSPYNRSSSKNLNSNPSNQDYNYKKNRNIDDIKFMYKVTSNNVESELLISQLNSQIELLQQDKRESNLLKMNYQKLLFDYNLLYDQKRQLEVQNENILNENQLLSKEISNIKEDLLCRIKEKDNKMTKLYDDNTSLNIILEETHNQLSKVKIQASHVDEENYSLRNQIEELNFRIEDYDKELKIKIQDNQDKEVMINNIMKDFNNTNRGKQELLDKLDIINKESKVHEERSYLESKKNNDSTNLLNSLSNELNEFKIKQEKLLEDNCKLYDELDITKEHLATLFEQNKVLVEELENVYNDNQIINQQLTKRGNINNLLSDNKLKINKSLESL